ncbi:helix-turn-helix domain-containing protein [Tsukamurella pseudospumae]|uniref:helix-turn-helix domain-containing protein n=1 Tax=Tsukamurella pseudospumae TaxID=239498 RepID=UPI0009E7BEB9
MEIGHAHESRRATTGHVTVAGAEQETGINRRTIQRAIYSGALRAYRPGAQKLWIARADLDAWLAERVVAPTQAHHGAA